MRRILTISGSVAGAVAAGTILTACVPGAGGSSYSNNYYENSYTNGQGYHDTYYTNSYTNH